MVNMKTSDIFPENTPQWPYPLGSAEKENKPQWVQPLTIPHPTANTTTSGYCQAVCCLCKKPISLNLTWKINHVASCYYCWCDNQITSNLLPRPYKTPKRRKLVDRSQQDRPLSSSWATTQASVDNFLRNPQGGL